MALTSATRMATSWLSTYSADPGQVYLLWLRRADNRAGISGEPLVKCLWSLLLLTLVCHGVAAETSRFRKVRFVNIFRCLCIGNIQILSQFQELFGQFGIANQVLAALGLPELAWLRSPNTSMMSTMAKRKTTKNPSSYNIAFPTANKNYG